MPTQEYIRKTQKDKPRKEWTLMFYFGGDNDLAPLMVSHLKAIKDAGFQENTDVLVYFDPNELGAPTRIFDVNRERKKKSKVQIGDVGDPFVRNMTEDDVEPDMINPDKGPASKAMRQALKKPDAIDAETALKNFLGFCRESHQANHYILFLVGHGLIVGNDAFLPDENPISALTLKNLGKILRGFGDHVKADKGAFELLAFHSCAMSAIEIAYELKATANYMIASEGTTFINSWPYHQLLEKIFRNVKSTKTAAQHKAKKGNAAQHEAARIANLIEKLYFLTVHNSTDFLLAGFSHDLALCSLDPQKFDGVAGLTEAIREFVTILIKGLEASNGVAATERGKRIKELVLLAHWEAQSYWQENYTDLFDFCLCLSRRCSDDLEDLRKACDGVMNKLKSKNWSERFQAPVIHSKHTGSLSQYSHGLSIYFPWSTPLEPIVKRSKETKIGDKKKDKEKGILEKYEKYTFTTDLKKSGGDTWLDFLKSYFKETRRLSRKEEDNATGSVARLLRGASDSVHPSNITPGVLSGTKPSPILSIGSPIVGVGCTCPSIKNYPQEESESKVPRAKHRTLKILQ